MKTRLRRLVIVLAVAYPVTLFMVVLLFRFVGEGWWVTTVGLYLPRVVFALPLLFFVPVLWWLKRVRLLTTQLVAGLIVLFPLLGLGFSVGAGAAGRPHIRVLSFNVNSEYSGDDAVLNAIVAYSPDVVLLQESVPWTKVIDGLRARYPFVHTSTQFVIASRFKLLSSTDPERLQYYNDARSPRFMKHVIETPLGVVTFFNVHPLSPRDSFYAVRGGGLRRQLVSGTLFDGLAADAVKVNTGLRTLQVQTFAELARRESGPVVLGGDTNLPGLSRLRARELGGFRDGFDRAGRGLGYTFPAKWPWMRIDRIMASDGLDFAHFEVGCRGVSDHLCVVADLVGN